ncbi:MAG: PD-(D/E)XK nuclease family protein, partial [Clostridia bacterium]|nr:PD-(D/E)XK nuclease family protein [Clostridia bacterium]
LLSGENGELYTNELKGVLMREIGGISVVESQMQYPKEHVALMENLFGCASRTEPKTDTDKVFYYEAVDCYDEIRHIAAVIRREVIGGMRYRDIAVAVGSTAAYKTAVSRIFSDYGIPYCLDDPRLLVTHPIAKLTVSYLDVLRSNYAPKDAVKLMKNPYFCADRSAADRFEAFVLSNALTAKNIKRGLYPTGNGQEEYGEDYSLFERERARITAFDKKCVTVSDFVSLLKELLLAVDAKGEAQRQELVLRKYGDAASAAFTGQAYEKTVAVLDSVSRILGDQPVSVSDFRNLLLSGYTACKVSVLPQLADAVYVGDYKECKYVEHSILFAAGLSGDVPFTKSDTAVLNDRDLAKLERFDCIVEPKIKIVNRRERENVGAALLSFTDRLYASRSVSGADGKPTVKSRVVDCLLSGFTHGGRALPVVTAAMLDAASKNKEGVYREASALRFNSPRPAMAEFIRGTAEYKAGAKSEYRAEAAYFAVLQQKTPEQASLAEKYLEREGSVIARELKAGSKLIFNGDTLSASVLESYFGCPFACFLQHGLRLAERETGEVKRNEYGTLLHQTLEDYVRLIAADLGKDERRVRDKATSDAVVMEILTAVSSDYKYAKYLETDKFKAMFELVGKEARRVAYAVFCQLEGSSFKPVETEAVFRDGAKYPALRINTPYGVKRINGKIDRVDRYDDYVRIIDYKTGKTHEDDESFYTGNNIQLYLYMNAFLGKDDKPAGAYYFPVSDKYAEGDANVYGMKGKTLSSESVVVATDNSVLATGGESSVLGARFEFKNGNATTRSKVLMNDGHFRAYLDYALMISEKGATEISDGVIAPSPYGSRCNTCRYFSVCGFDPSIGSERKEKGVNEQTVADAVEVQNGLNK